MRKLLLFACFVWFGCATALAQSPYYPILQAFSETDNDSLFITRYSTEPYERFTARRSALPHTFEYVDSLLFYHHQQGAIIGPYELDSTVFFIKVTRVDSALRMHVGNLYLDPAKKGKDRIATLATTLLQTAQRKHNFNALCNQYKDDQNTQPDCDLGWFFEGAMVSEFEHEVKKHRKGDYFLVNTRFGTHVVKVLDNPVRDRSAVEYVFLYLTKQ